MFNIILNFTHENIPYDVKIMSLEFGKVQFHVERNPKP